MRHSSLILIALLSLTNAWSQAFKFTRFGERQGIGIKFINTLAQGPYGRLYIGTSEGLYRYDGLQFRYFTTADSLSDNLIETSFVQSDGAILLGHGDGTLTLIENDRLQQVILNPEVNSRVTDIIPDTKDKIWISTQNSGLFVKSGSNWEKLNAPALDDYNVYSIMPHTGYVWIGTDMGLLRGRPDNNGALSVEEIAEVPMSGVRDIAINTEGAIVVVTEDQGIFSITQKGSEYTVTPVTTQGKSLSDFFFHHIRITENEQLWLSTNSHGLIKLDSRSGNDYSRITYYRDQSEQKNFSARCSFLDREGNLWIGAMGEGLLLLEDDFFSTLVLDNSESPKVHSMHASDEIALAGLDGKIAAINAEGKVISEYTSSWKGLPSEPIIAIYQDAQGTVWAGTHSSGLYRKTSQSNAFRPVKLSDDLLSRRINAIIDDGEHILAGTDNGLFLLNGEKVVNRLTMENGLGGNVVRGFFRDSQNRIWIGTSTSGFNYMENGQLNTLEIPLVNTSFPVRCFTEDNTGMIWAGTEGSGIIAMDAENLIVIRKENGLYSDFCYSMLCDQFGKIWIGHRGALSAVETATSRISTRNPDETGEIRMLENAACKLGGQLFFGTSYGLLRYEPGKDLGNTYAPYILVDAVIINDNAYPTSGEIRLSAGDYKLEINYSGITLRNAPGVTYTYILEGYDDHWCDPVPDRRALYKHLPPGEYTFRIKAINSDGISSEELASFTITVARPFWQQWWFIALAIFSIIALVRLIIHRREHFLKQNQEYLKTELAARTGEVVRQKELLEIKNKDITDSIVYAKNIQKAVLPSHEEIKKRFPDSFVYYKPRDIVSGDFYWIGETEDRVIIACADCTGHGVPGAFMSLIGSMLMNEVASDQSVQGPEQFLLSMHNKLNLLLQSQSNVNNLSDGMDLSVVEIHRAQGLIKIASANRPVILKIAGIIQEIRGDRRPVGGTTHPNGAFNCHTFTWSEGDQVYLFSDGVTDQFGGPSGKKIKRSGLLQLIHEISNLEMTEQRTKFKDFFHEWKGNLPQLDDVILIGIRG
jgi:ligand-binding sensor domain-containing protein/serine phosphatase RsbU (regulator of sigma subunit)